MPLPPYLIKLGAALPWWSPLAAVGAAVGYAVLTTTAPGGDDPLVPGTWYRMRIAVDPAKTNVAPDGAVGPPVVQDEPWLREQLRVAAFREVAYAKRGDFYRDPFSWDVIARWTGEPGTMDRMRVARRIRVANPSLLASYPPALLWGADPSRPGEAQPVAILQEAVDHASVHEMDPVALDHAAALMLPDRPESARLLTARRDVLRRIAEPASDGVSPTVSVSGLARPAGPMVGISQSGFIALGLFGPLAGPFLSKQDRDETIDALASTGRDFIQLARTVAPFIQLGVSFVPGIGQVASAAIGAGVAFATGAPIDEVLLAGARGAFPGGPLVLQAIETGVRTVANTARGQRVDRAFLDGLRKSLSREERIAFDAIVALAEGKRVQDVATGAAAQISPEVAAVYATVRDGRPLDLVQAGAARAGLPLEARVAFDTVLRLTRERDFNEAAVAAVRASLSPDMRPALDAGVAAARGRDPRQAVILGAQDLVPDDPEARAAADVVRRALAGRVSPATLSGDARKFIPNLPANRGLVPQGEEARREAERIAALGPKAYASPTLYMPQADVDQPSLAASDEQARVVAAWQQLFEAAERKRNLPAAQEAELREWQRANQGRIDAILWQGRLDQIAADRNAAKREALRERWAEQQREARETAARGGIPSFSPPRPA